MVCPSQTLTPSPFPTFASSLFPRLSTGPSSSQALPDTPTSFGLWLPPIPQGVLLLVHPFGGGPQSQVFRTLPSRPGEGFVPSGRTLLSLQELNTQWVQTGREASGAVWLGFPGQETPGAASAALSMLSLSSRQQRLPSWFLLIAWVHSGVLGQPELQNNSEEGNPAGKPAAPSILPGSARASAVGRASFPAGCPALTEEKMFCLQI